MYRMLNVATQRLRGTSEIASDMVLWGEGAQKRAITDELTGAYNRRFLEDSLGGYVAEAAEKGRPLALAMVDLDHFREINERHGHERADGIIKSVVGRFRTLLGPTAVVARYGGDEFVLILPGLATGAAAAALGTVCASIAAFDALTAADGTVTRVSASMGVAAYPADAPDVAALRKAADAALYRAKEEGRNRVVPAGGAPAVLPHDGPAAAAAAGVGVKTPPRTIKQKNDAIANIIAAITGRNRFLMLGHQSPDDDCIASMVSFALLLRLFTRQAALYFGAEPHEHFRYLLDICRFNGIRLLLPGAPAARGHRGGRAVRHAEARDDRGERRGPRASGPARRAPHRDRPPFRGRQRLLRRSRPPAGRRGLVVVRAGRAADDEAPEPAATCSSVSRSPSFSPATWCSRSSRASSVTRRWASS